MPPQAAAGSVATTTLGASIAAGITTDLIEAFGRPTIEGGGNWVRWTIAKKLKYDHTLLEAYDSFVDAEAHSLIGTSTRGIWHVIRTFVDCCVKMSVILPHEMIDELIMEMIQEGVSNAIQTSFGGALQTHLNVYRGGAPPYPDHVIDVLFQGDKMDLKLRALNAAATGANLPSFAFYGADAVARKLAGEFDRVDTAVSSKLDEIDDAYWELVRSRVRIAQRYLEAQAEKRWMVERRVADLFEQAARRYLARLNELYSDLESIKVFVDMGLVEQETDASITVDEIKAEAEAVVRAMEELVHEVEEAKREVFGVISLDHAPLVDALEALHSEVSKIISTYYQEKFGFFELVRDIVDETFSAVRAYRYYTDYGAFLPEGSPEAPTDPVFTIEVAEETTVEETHPKYVHDRIRFGDWAKAYGRRRKEVEDAIALTDEAQARLPEKVCGIFDAINFADAAQSSVVGKGVYLEDSISICDAVQKRVSDRIVTVEDGIEFTDYAAAGGRWYRLADLPDYFTRGELVRFDNALYYMFGLRYCPEENRLYDNHTIYVYNPSTDTWSLAAEYGTLIYRDFKACKLGPYIYMLGGSGSWSSAGITADEMGKKLFRFDPATNTVTDTGADYIERVENQAMEGYEEGNVVIVAGGWYLDSSTMSMDTMKYSPETNTWTETTSMPFPCDEMQSTMNGSILYTTAGYALIGQQITYLDIVLCFDAEMEMWEGGPELPFPYGIEDHAMGHYGSRLYIVGGDRHDLGRCVNDLWIYDFNTAVWSLGSPYPAGPVEEVDYDNYEGGFVVAGGYSPGVGYIKEVWRYVEAGAQGG